MFPGRQRSLLPQGIEEEDAQWLSKNSGNGVQAKITLRRYDERKSLTPSSHEKHSLITGRSQESPRDAVQLRRRCTVKYLFYFLAEYLKSSSMIEECFRQGATI